MNLEGRSRPARPTVGVVGPIAPEVAALADRVAAPGGEVGAGVVAGATLALAAALVELGCHRPRAGWAEADGAAAQAEALRRRSLLLADADAVAYVEARAALAGDGGAPDGARDRWLGAALTRAAQAPLALAQAASDVAQLAAAVVDEVSDEVRPDVACAAVLAEAVARAGAHLVEVNLSIGAHDDRRAHAWEHAADARDASARALPPHTVAG